LNAFLEEKLSRNNTLSVIYDGDAPNFVLASIDTSPSNWQSYPTKKIKP